MKAAVNLLAVINHGFFVTVNIAMNSPYIHLRGNK